MTEQIISSRTVEMCSNELVTYLLQQAVGKIRTNNILLVIMNIAFALCGSFSNLFVILTYWRARDARMRRLSNMLVVALAFSDFLVTVLIQPLFIARKGYYEIFGYKNCFLFAFLRLCIIFSCAISAFTAVLVTAERWIAISRPYLYPQLITRARLKVIIFMGWTTGFVFVCARVWFLSGFVLNILVSIIATIYIISMSLMWIHIFIMTRKHKKAISRQLTVVQITEQHKENHSIAYIIVLSLTLCYMPIVIASIYGSYYDTINNSLDYLYVYLPWAETLVFFNSMVNSALFTWREKKFRHAFLELFKFKRNLVAAEIVNAKARTLEIGSCM